MERKEIESKVNAFLVEEMEIEAGDINNEAKLKEDLGLDSLDFVDIVVIVEKTFGFKLKPEEMSNVLTVKEFCDYIESKMQVCGHE
ncbi:MAG: phosphopantetheine-binding protein [Tannerella sp.]|jgi:acyl carrier protein|nr:phosphopantetheine-binding protein [Tannerella sp.]